MTDQTIFQEALVGALVTCSNDSGAELLAELSQIVQNHGVNWEKMTFIIWNWNAAQADKNK